MFPLILPFYTCLKCLHPPQWIFPDMCPPSNFSLSFTYLLWMCDWARTRFFFFMPALVATFLLIWDWICPKQTHYCKGLHLLLLSLIFLNQNGNMWKFMKQKKRSKDQRRRKLILSPFFFFFFFFCTPHTLPTQPAWLETANIQLSNAASLLV